MHLTKWPTLLVRLPILLLLLTGLLLGTSTNLSASWVGFTPKQLVESSEIILIGEIVGPVGQKPGYGLIGEKLGFRTLGYTLWKVNVRYYLKGNQDLNEYEKAMTSTNL